MEKGIENSTAEEETPDSFLCCICLDLLYKPIVLSCGHISCFWCVHKSMDALESLCPICRRSYKHFPSICWMLHFLLLKMYPLAYCRREKQTLVEEKRMDCFSPQLPNTRTNDNHEQLSATDVQCVACKHLLFRPVILNCGHAYCETCVPSQVNEMPRCQVCQSLHPSAFPKICLELDHFLEVQFPKAYELRRNTAQTNNQDVKTESTSSCSTMSGAKGFPILSAPTADHMMQPSDPNSMVHIGVGCDFCGMFPIVGDRYRCKDCVEKIGFDLCGDCYKSRFKLPGRFNQQHTPDHEFELVDVYQNPIAQLLYAPSRGTEIHVSNFDGAFFPDAVPYVNVSSDDAGSLPAALILQADNEEEDEDGTPSSLVASNAHTGNTEDHDMYPTS